MSALNNLLRPLDLYFFEDDGVVRIAGKGAAQPDAPRVQVQAIEIINKPIVTDEGAELTLFMRPEIAKGIGAHRGGLAYAVGGVAGRCAPAQRRQLVWPVRDVVRSQGDLGNMSPMLTIRHVGDLASVNAELPAKRRASFAGRVGCGSP